MQGLWGNVSQLTKTVTNVLTEELSTDSEGFSDEDPVESTFPPEFVREQPKPVETPAKSKPVEPEIIPKKLEQPEFESAPLVGIPDSSIEAPKENHPEEVGDPELLDHLTRLKQENDSLKEKILSLKNSVHTCQNESHRLNSELEAAKLERKRITDMYSNKNATVEENARLVQENKELAAENSELQKQQYIRRRKDAKLLEKGIVKGLFMRYAEEAQLIKKLEIEAIRAETNSGSWFNFAAPDAQALKDAKARLHEIVTFFSKFIQLNEDETVFFFPNMFRKNLQIPYNSYR